MGDAALSKVGRERRVVMTMPVFSGVYRAVSESELIAILPIQLAQTVAPYAGLTVYKAPIEIPTVQIVMIWHRRYSSSPAHVWVRDLIAELLAPLDAMHW
jgi:DNA-binding transcriptional LysR family regulator